ncbi:glycosyltransferase family 4 protein [Flavobacterium sp. ANB]|uniref:glycosyltransferase family 4 protein n=1 Tax=unclassified Flavobacterium TaxID=196869 RepID=UPI0012B85657|nr:MULTISPECIES: glycosyltransferase family 4 protein [unclassified Flavobacterium]MBF4517568.1 glycosyltransferase family 4 protein [Flavobacterium sp. ANB]MTD70295.1 glycosyltransferase [Flavobacterium sp. LC2016-13]
MRIAQLIDSLDAGGAERMAVNYANALAGKITFSGLVATRKEGSLKDQIHPDVSYLFLQKKRSLDFSAILRLRKYIVSNKIEILHAHSSSFFIAVLVKLTLPKVKIVWHDHYGTRAKETKKENRVLIFLSMFFSSIFVVNLQLKEWSKKNMKCSNVIFIPNFTASENVFKPETTLKGINGKRIVFLANLKNPKNHILILEAFLALKLNELDWSLHLIGKDYFDAYSDVLKDFIKLHSLENDIHLYGSKNDVKHILSQATIGVLSSTQEGFPVTLLEYGLANLAVVSTNVGYCSVVIKNEVNGLLFDPSSSTETKKQLSKMIQNDSFRKEMSNNLKQLVVENYSEEVVINKLISAYQ